MRQHRIIQGSTVSSAGFTLLELMVAMVILSLIMTLSFSALHTGLKSWSVAADHIEQHTDARLAAHFIRSKLSQLYPITWQRNADKAIAFNVTSDGIKWIGPSPLGREVETYFEYYLFARQQLSGYELVIHFEPYYPGDTEFKVNEESPERVLLKDLEQIEFKLFGNPDVIGELGWLTEWDEGMDYYPNLIQINATPLNEADKPVQLAINMPSQRLER